MSPLKTSLLVVVASVVVTAGGLHLWQQKRFREVRTLKSQNDRLRLQANQRVRSHPPATPPPGPASPVLDAAGSAPVSSPPVRVQRMAEYYRNEGNATPLATLQTFAWACDRGDTGTVRRMLFIEEAARPKAEAFMAGLPENVRAQWKTVDEMAAAILTESIMARPFPRADVLETATPEEVAPGRIKLRLPNVPKDGTEYQQTAEGWKYVLTEKAVDDYIQHARRQTR